MMSGRKAKRRSRSKIRYEAVTIMRTPSGPQGETGFTLLSVLLVTTMISALALGATVVARGHLRSTNVELQALQARTLADAGLTRIIASLETPEDRLLASLRTSPVRWSYAGAELVLELESEAGKVDLNSGDGELVQSVLRAVIREKALADRTLQRWLEFRRSGREIETIDLLLSPQEMFSGIASDLERHLTTVSGARGIDPLAASDLVLRHVPGISEGDLRLIARIRAGALDKSELVAIKRRYQPLLDGERPLYRIRSTVNLPRQIAMRREALVARDDDTGKAHVFFWRNHVERGGAAASSGSFEN